MSVEFTTPTMRLVWGDPFKAVPLIDDVTKKPKVDAAGQPMIEYSFGVAIAKGDPAWPTFHKLLKDADKAAWPQFHDANGAVMPGVIFADKITDGDGFNKKGGKRAQPGNGYEGCWIVKFASRFPPSVYKPGNGAWVQALPADLKCGDYIQVNGSTQSNGSAQSSGMYRNVSMVTIWGQGVEIVKSGNPEDKFGAPPPGGPGPGPTAPAPGATVPPAAPATPPPAPVATGGPTMLPAAGGVTYAAYVAGGWTDAQLIASGFMAAPIVVAAPPPVPAAPPAAPATPPPAPVATGGPTMLPAAGGVTYAAYVAGGWTDAQLIASGFMAAPIVVAAPPPVPAAPPAPPPAPAAPAAPLRQMLPSAGATPYEGWIAAGWTDAQLVAAGHMAA